MFALTCPAVRSSVTVHTPPLPAVTVTVDLWPWPLSFEAFPVFPPSPAADKMDTVSQGHGACKLKVLHVSRLDVYYSASISCENALRQSQRSILSCLWLWGGVQGSEVGDFIFFLLSYFELNKDQNQQWTDLLTSLKAPLLIKYYERHIN